MITKTEAAALRKKFQDYIPGGRSLTSEEIARLQFRATTELEVLHCGTRMGHDIQSGPTFCGALADFVAEMPEGRVAVCDRHRRRIGR